MRNVMRKGAKRECERLGETRVQCIGSRAWVAARGLLAVREGKRCIFLRAARRLLTGETVSETA